MAESGSAVAESPLSGLPDSILNEVSVLIFTLLSLSIMFS